MSAAYGSRFLLRSTVVGRQSAALFVSVFERRGPENGTGENALSYTGKNAKTGLINLFSGQKVFPQGLKPASLLASDGAAESRAPSRPIYGTSRRC